MGTTNHHCDPFVASASYDHSICLCTCALRVHDRGALELQVIPVLY